MSPRAADGSSSRSNSEYADVPDMFRELAKLEPDSPRFQRHRDRIVEVTYSEPAKALLPARPLHSFLMHRDIPFDDALKIEAPRDRHLHRLIDFGEGSETCVPVSSKAKRPSRSAKCR